MRHHAAKWMSVAGNRRRTAGRGDITRCINETFMTLLSVLLFLSIFYESAFKIFIHNCCWGLLVAEAQGPPRASDATLPSLPGPSGCTCSLRWRARPDPPNKACARFPRQRLARR